MKFLIFFVYINISTFAYSNLIPIPVVFNLASQSQDLCGNCQGYIEIKSDIGSQENVIDFQENMKHQYPVRVPSDCVELLKEGIEKGGVDVIGMSSVIGELTTEKGDFFLSHLTQVKYKEVESKSLFPTLNSFNAVLEEYGTRPRAYYYQCSEGQTKLVGTDVALGMKSWKNVAYFYNVLGIDNSSIPLGAVVMKKKYYACMIAENNKCIAYDDLSYLSECSFKDFPECQHDETQYCDAGNGYGFCLHLDVQCFAEFKSEEVQNKTLTEKIIRCGDCRTVVKRLDKEINVTYIKGDDLITYGKLNDNNPPEGCLKGGAGTVYATANITVSVLCLFLWGFFQFDK